MVRHQPERHRIVLLIVILVLSLPFFVSMLFYGYKSQKEVVLTTHISLYSLSLSANGELALFGGNQDKAWLLNLQSRNVVQNFGVESPMVVSVDLSADAKRAALCEANGTISLWDIDSGNRLVRFTHTIPTASDDSSDLSIYRLRIALSPDTSKLLILDRMDGLRLLDGNNGETLQVLDEKNPQKIPWFDFSPDGKQVIVLDMDDGVVRIYDLESNEKTVFEIPSFDCSVALLTSDGKTLVAGGDDRFIRFFDLELQKQIRVMRHPEPITALSMSPDGSRLYVGGYDGILSIWNLHTYQFIDSFRRDQGKIFGIANFGSFEDLFVIDRNGKFWHWDSLKGKCLWLIDGFTTDSKNRIISQTKSNSIPNVFLQIRNRLPLLKKPLDREVIFHDERINEILLYVQDELGIPIEMDLDINKKPVFIKSKDASEVLESMLMQCDYGYVVLEDGTIHIGRYGTLDGYTQDQRAIHQSIQDLDSQIYSVEEFMYISELIDAIDPEKTLHWVIDEERFNRVTLKLDHPTPLQILEAVLLPNGLDFSVDRERIFVGRQIAGLVYDKDLLQKSSTYDPTRLDVFQKKIEGTLRVENQPLSDLLKDLGAQLRFEHEYSETDNPLITIQLQSPTLAHVFDSILPAQGMGVGLKNDGTILIGQEETIEQRTDLLFSPNMLKAFILQYHARFPTSQTVYQGTDRSVYRPDKSMVDKEHKIFELYKTILSLREKYGESFTEQQQSKEIVEIGQELGRYSDEQLKQIIEERTRFHNGLVRSATRIFSVKPDSRSLEVLWPDGVPKWLYYYYNDHNKGMFFFDQSSFWRMNPREEDTLIIPDHPLRFGADLDWFLQNGYRIDYFDAANRTIEIMPIADPRFGPMYKFTLLEGHNTYWKVCECIQAGKIQRRIVCDDFIEKDGMLIPQKVMIQDPRGLDFYFLVNMTLCDSLGSVLRYSYDVDRICFYYEYEMELEDVTVNQPVEIQTIQSEP